MSNESKTKRGLQCSLNQSSTNRESNLIDWIDETNPLELQEPTFIFSFAGHLLTSVSLFHHVFFEFMAYTKLTNVDILLLRLKGGLIVADF